MLSVEWVFCKYFLPDLFLSFFLLVMEGIRSGLGTLEGSPRSLVSQCILLWECTLGSSAQHRETSCERRPGSPPTAYTLRGEAGKSAQLSSHLGLATHCPEDLGESRGLHESCVRSSNAATPVLCLSKGCCGNKMTRHVKMVCKW